MSDLAKTTDTAIKGGQTPSAATAYELWNQNDTALRDLIYGPTRQVESASPPHDHAEDGGEVLDAPLLSAVFGPQASETAGGTPQVGVPYGINATASYLASDDTGSSKLLAACPLFIPGGVSQVRVRILIYYAGSGSLQFQVQLAPFSRVNYRSLAGVGTQGQSSTVSFGGAGFQKVDVTLTSLTALGDATKDRLCELRIYQSISNSVAHRLVGVHVSATSTTGARQAASYDPPRAKILVSDLVDGPITPELMQRAKRVVNGHAVALLGRAPGLNADNTPDRKRTYQQEVYYPHQHQGHIVPQFDGTFISDGACLRRAVVGCYPRNLGDDGSYNIDATPAKGIKIHPAGTLSSTWLHLKYVMSIPAGLGGLDLYFAVQPATTDIKTEFRAHVDVRPVSNSASSSSIVSSVKSGPHVQEQNDANNYRVCQVDPLIGDGWQTNKTRRNKFGLSKGLWTLDALLPASQVPAGYLRDNTPARISQPVRVELTHRYVRSTDAFRQTQDCTVYFRVELKTLDSGNYDANARLLWVMILPAKGW